MNLTQDDLDAIAVAYRLGIMKDQDEGAATAMVHAALQQRHPLLTAEEVASVSETAIEKIKVDREDWMAGDDVVSDENHPVLEGQGETVD
ncbi:MAG: hypothetical protein NXI16_16300 [Alphaproteobacteria bacterium]|nr:hypothetical protein [Alphaproteobacteria bacterium]